LIDDDDNVIYDDVDDCVDDVDYDDVDVGNDYDDDDVDGEDFNVDWHNCYEDNKDDYLDMYGCRYTNMIIYYFSISTCIFLICQSITMIMLIISTLLFHDRKSTETMGRFSTSRYWRQTNLYCQRR